MSFFESLDNLKDEEPIFTNVAFSVVEYSYDSFLSKLENPNVSDHKICELIMFGDYFNYDNFKNKNTTSVFQMIWTNHRFLTCVRKSLENYPAFLSNVKSKYLTSINMIVYNYYAANLNNEDSEQTIELLFDILDIINKDFIIPLTSIVDVTVARFITLARFSSYNKRESAKLLNNFIVNIGYEFSVSDIVYIYVMFYQNDFSTIFNTTMTTDVDYTSLTDRQKKMFNNISIAILNILMSMTSVEMINTLRSYASYLFLINYGNKVRFSFKNIPDSYEYIDRLNAVIEELEAEGYPIP